MNIIILGAGAVGSVFGAKLSRFNNVILIARQEHANQINKMGLKIKGIENSNYKLTALTELNEIKENTIIILSTKVHDSGSGISPIKKILRKDTIILCLQNGFDSENAVKNIVKGKCLVLRAVTNIGAVYLQPGIVEFNGHSYTAIEKSPKSSEIAANFRKCGLSTYVSDDIKSEIWKKLIMNCVINPLTAIFGVRNNEISDGKFNMIKSQIMEECLKVAKKEGFAFEGDILQIMNRAIRNSNNMSSMQQDLLKGRKTEIDFLNGAIVRLSVKYGIKTPINECLVKIIKEMEKITAN